MIHTETTATTAKDDTTPVRANWLALLGYPVLVVLFFGPLFFLFREIREPFKVPPETFIVCAGWAFIAVAAAARAMTGRAAISLWGAAWSTRLLTLFMLWLVVSSVATGDAAAHLPYVASVVTYLLVGICLSDWLVDDPRRRNFVLALLAGVTSYELLLAVLQHAKSPAVIAFFHSGTNPTITSYLKVAGATAKPGSPVGTLGNANYLSEMLVAVLPPLAMGLASRRRWVQAGTTLLLLFGAYVIISAATRSAVLGLGIAIPVAVVLTWGVSALQPKAWWGNRRARIAVFATAVVLGIILAAAGGKMMAKVGKGGVGEGDVQSRLVNWQSAVDIWRDHPISGAGLGGFKLENVSKLRKAYPDGLPSSASMTRFLQAHNEPVQTLSETGIVGFLLLLAAIVAWIREVRVNPNLPQALKFGLLAGLGGLLVASCFGFPFHIPVTALVIVAIVALGMGGVTAASADAPEARLQKGPARVSYVAAMLLCIGVAAYLVISRAMLPVYQAGIYLYLGAQMADSKKPEGAEDLFGLAAKLDRYKAVGAFQQMKTLVKQGRNLEAIAVYDANVDKGLGMDAKLLKAKALDKVGRREEALAAFEAVTHYYAKDAPNGKYAAQQIARLRRAHIEEPAAAETPEPDDPH